MFMPSLDMLDSCQCCCVSYFHVVFNFLFVLRNCGFLIMMLVMMMIIIKGVLFLCSAHVRIFEILYGI